MVLHWVIRGVQILHDALADGFRGAGRRGDGGQGAVRTVGMGVKRGNIDALQLGGLGQVLLLGPVICLGGLVERKQLPGQVLALAQAEEVDKIGQGLRVIGAGAPGDDKLVEPRPVLAERSGIPASCSMLRILV